MVSRHQRYEMVRFRPMGATDVIQAPSASEWILGHAGDPLAGASCLYLRHQKYFTVLLNGGGTPQPSPTRVDGWSPRRILSRG
jgi:hypothetical protein